MNIFLIGSMGVGKSSLGKRIANRLAIPFVDTDEEIVDNECKSINSIFKEEGEPYFRAQEAEIIRSFDATKTQIIATGGGLPMYHENMKYMLDNGIVIYLHLDLDTLAERLFKGRAKRPAIRSLNMAEIKDKLSAMLQDRSLIYEQAHIKYYRFDNIKKETLELSKYLKLFL